MLTHSLFQTTRRLVFGRGAFATLPEEVCRLKGSRVMIITDEGIVKAGIAQQAEKMLSGSGITCECFFGVTPDPAYEIADQAARKAKDFGADVLVGLGGGSSLDIAKVASVLLTNEGSVVSFFGVDAIQSPGLMTILIPTTAGTGSEVTPIVILSDEQEKLKKGIVSPYLFPDAAIIDPELTIHLPAHVTAATGMDAFIHAIEAYTSKNANSMTDMFAEKAIKLIHDNLRMAYCNGMNIESRSHMMEGSLLAGMAFANAGVTAVHAFAYPIGAEFHIPHGTANSIMLAPVMEFNMMGNLQKFSYIAELMGRDIKNLTKREAAVQAVDDMKVLAKDLQIPESLSTFGVEDHHVDELAQGVMKVTRLLANNPRKIELQNAQAIYRQVI